MFETKPISHNALHFVTSVYHSFMASIFFFNAINVGLFFFLSMGCLSLFLISCSIQVLLMFSSLDLLINYDLGECNLHMAYFCEFMVYLHESASAWRVQDTMSTSQVIVGCLDASHDLHVNRVFLANTGLPRRHVHVIVWLASMEEWCTTNLADKTLSSFQLTSLHLHGRQPLSPFCRLL